MSQHAWIRNPHSARTRANRRTPARWRPIVEALENRVTPAVTDLSVAEVYVEDMPLNLVDIVISDTVNATANMTVSDPAAGSLSTATEGTVTSTYDAAAGLWTATGAVADVNALLAGLIFTPAPDYNANFDIAVSVTDDTTTFTGNKLMTGTPVNDQPAADDLSFSTDEDTAVNGTLTGDDGDPEATQALTFAIGTSPSHGSVTLDTVTGAFTYTPDADYTGPDSFTFTATDDASAGGAALTSDPATGTVTVNAVNDAPVVTAPSEQTTPEDIGVTITGISVSDVDVNEGTGEIMITLSVGAGTLSVGTSVAGGLSGDQISGNGAGAVVLQGPIDAVNATLAAGVTYLSNLNFNGFDSLLVEANDLGNTGAGGPQTASATVSIHVLSPAEQVAGLREMVLDLATAGAFKNKGRLNSLLTKLRQMDAALESGRGKVAFNVAGAFINHLQAFRSARILTPAQADPLIAAAMQLQTSLSTGGFAVASPSTASATPSTNPGNGHGAGNAHNTTNGQGAGNAQNTGAAATTGNTPGSGHGHSNGHGNGHNGANHGNGH